MANALFDAGKQGFLDGAISWSTDPVRMHLIDAADHTFNLSTDRDVADVAGAAIEETTSNLASKTVTDGVADCADPTFTAAAGDVCEELLVAENTGVAANDTLIARWDTVTGMPVTLNGGDVTVTVNASGLLSL